MGRASRRRHRHRKPQRPGPDPEAPTASVDQTYSAACTLAQRGDFDQSRDIYQQLLQEKLPQPWGALVENDLGTLAALSGELTTARLHFTRALELDPNCRPARSNLDLLGSDTAEPFPAEDGNSSRAPLVPGGPRGRVRVAIVSLLFSWPSTGGGTVHTAEVGKFLAQAGFEVRHLYAQYDGWGVGQVTQPLDVPAEALKFTPADWALPEIQRRFREAVDRFAPDYVIITDSWNFKPHLATALHGYRYFLRLAAQECLCPLNNVRLLVDAAGRPSACPKNQLATFDACRTCVQQRAFQSGALHQAERELSGYGTPEYAAILQRAFAEAEGVLAVNPLIAAAVSPFAKAVHVVPSGFDVARFPEPEQENREPVGAASVPGRKRRIFFAGLVQEYMKGFRVLHTACAELWQRRQDFELVATADPVGQVDDMTHFIGWQSQADLPAQIGQADFLVFPTIAEEALGRSAVEAMGVGRPVIASRIGGLPYTVIDGLTGLLFEPGNPSDLAEKIERLLDDPALCVRMGHAARQRFLQQFTWDVIIDTQYRRLLTPVRTSSPSA